MKANVNLVRIGVSTIEDAAVITVVSTNVAIGCAPATAAGIDTVKTIEIDIGDAIAISIITITIAHASTLTLTFASAVDGGASTDVTVRPHARPIDALLCTSDPWCIAPRRLSSTS